MSELVIYYAKDRIEAEMVTEILQNARIPAFYKGVGGGGIMDVYGGNSLCGEAIYVNREQAEEAKKVLQELNFQ